MFHSRFLLSRVTQTRKRECSVLRILSTRRRDIQDAAEIVRKGGVVAYPTDTVYGLACDPHNPRALRRLMSAKGRQKKPLPILVASPRAAQRIVVVDRRANELARAFWPGPLTLVLKARVRFPRSLTLGRKTIAIRCPDDRTALRLISRCGGLLTGTSANLTGQPPCTSAAMVRRFLGDKIDGVVDGGPSRRRVGSTIVRVDSRGATILRKGPIRKEQVMRAFLGASRRHKNRH